MKLVMDVEFSEESDSSTFQLYVTSTASIFMTACSETVLRFYNALQQYKADKYSINLHWPGSLNYRFMMVYFV